jgi:NADPH:quinone reductase-like Zn-dependent oxidoreductase
VTGLRPGDEVFGWTAGGAFAEYVAVPAANLAPKPPGISLEQAGTVGVAAFTALQALRDRGGVGQDTRVLINGASGGVGTFAVQIAATLGAEITAVCSTRNVAQAAALGASRVVDYRAADLADERRPPGGGRTDRWRRGARRRAPATRRPGFPQPAGARIRTGRRRPCDRHPARTPRSSPPLPDG